MYVRTIYQPFASAIFAGVKNYETAPRRTHIRGRIYIHAAKHTPREVEQAYIRRASWLQGADWQRCVQWLENMPRGAIIGSVAITDCVPVEHIVDGLSQLEVMHGDYAPGRWAYKLERPILLAKPIPIGERQGWWTFEEN